MSTSSAPKSLPTDLFDLSNITLTSDSTADTMTSGTIYISDPNWTGSSGSCITTTTAGSTFSTLSVSPTYTTISISDLNIDTNQYTFNFPVDWQDQFPAWSRVQDMCKQYPGLKIAFENLRVVYEMCKDDYDNPTPKK